MKVYVVAVEYDWEGFAEPDVAFDNRDAAEKYIRELKWDPTARPQVFELEVRS